MSEPRELPPATPYDPSLPNQSVKSRIITFTARFAPQSERGTFLLVFAITLATRLPFIDAGYGTAPDAWRLARIAILIKDGGEYLASRLPGYPLPEIVMSQLWSCQPLALNGATALMSAFAAAFFAITLRRLGSSRVISCSLAFALTPLIFLNSVITLDVIWALAFIMAALYASVREKPLVAGVLLGCAIGCRITSGAMIVPLAIVLWTNGSPTRNPRKLALFALATGAIGAMWFCPVFLKYGAGFFSFEQYTAYPEWSRIKWMLKEKTWGIIGTKVAYWSLLLLAIRFSYMRYFQGRALTVSGRIVLASVVAIAIYLGAFFSLPHERYLVPVIPFALLLFDSLAGAWLSRLLYFGLILSPFMYFCGGFKACPGPIYEDQDLRLKQMEFIDNVITASRNIDSNAVIVSGWWLPQIQTILMSERLGHEKFVYLIDSTEIAVRKSSGVKVYYLSGMDEYNREAKGVSLRELGATQLTLK